jgi:hypothetical protein
MPPFAASIVEVNDLDLQTRFAAASLIRCRTTPPGGPDYPRSVQ